MKINKLNFYALVLITLLFESSYAQTLNTQLVIDSGSCEYSRKISKKNIISGQIVWSATVADDGKYKIQLTDNNKTSPFLKMLRLKSDFSVDKNDGSTSSTTDAKENATYLVAYDNSKHNVTVSVSISKTTDFSEVEIRYNLGIGYGQYDEPYFFSNQESDMFNIVPGQTLNDSKNIMDEYNLINCKKV